MYQRQPLVSLAEFAKAPDTYMSLFCYAESPIMFRYQLRDSKTRTYLFPRQSLRSSYLPGL